MGDWASLRKCTNMLLDRNNFPAEPVRFISEKLIESGSSDSDATDDAVRPTGSPSTVAVISVTPAGCPRKTSRNAASRSVLLISITRPLENFGVTDGTRTRDT